MAEQVTLHPRTVEYDPITGVPAEFNEYLPKDSEEYKKYVFHFIPFTLLLHAIFGGNHKQFIKAEVKKQK